MFFSNKDDGNERHGTVIAALGIDPNKLNENYLEFFSKRIRVPLRKG